VNDRLDYAKIAPEAVEGLRTMERRVHASTLSPRLLELVKIRASQLNGCAHCIDMHTKIARSQGETEPRIDALRAWRETTLFDVRERAAFAWVEALTAIDGGVPDDLYAVVREHFDETQMGDLTCAVVAINGWNRLVIAFGRISVAGKPAAAGR
jgi:AhpD family alkylhydroperoxidase